GDHGVSEHMGMAAQHLLGDGTGHVVEGEEPRFLGHARVEYHLKEKVAELILETGRIAALARLGHLIRLLDRIWGDGVKVLFAIPGAAARGITQLRHHLEEARQGGGIAHVIFSERITASSKPHHVAARQIATEPTILNPARRHSPSRTRLSVWRLNEEKVV